MPKSSPWEIISPFLTRKCELGGEPPDNDPQVLAIYNFDREVIGSAINTRCSRKHLVTVTRHACRKYGVPEPRIVIKDLQKRVFGQCDDDGIELNGKFHGANLGVLLHELAHWITDRLHEDEQLDGHGPEFAKVYMQLLAQYRLFPEDAFRVVARRLGIKISRKAI